VISRASGRPGPIYNPYTVVNVAGRPPRRGAYHVEYKQFLERWPSRCRDAAALSGDAAFAKFLRMRADALLTDDYYQSDLAWLDLKDPKFRRHLRALRKPTWTTCWCEYLLRRFHSDPQRSGEPQAGLYQKYVPGHSGRAAARRGRPSFETRPRHPHGSDGRALPRGRSALRLPGRGRQFAQRSAVHQEKGSKKIFFKNFMDARVANIILPIAKTMMQPGQAEKVSADGYLTGTVSA